MAPTSPADESEPVQRLTLREQTVHVAAYETIRNIELRRHVTWAVVALFVAVNVSVVALLFYLGASERRLTEAALRNVGNDRELLDTMLAHRLVTPGVLISLISGTVVEIGTVILLIAKYLFPPPVVRRVSTRRPKRDIRQR